VACTRAQLCVSGPASARSAAIATARQAGASQTVEPGCGDSESENAPDPGSRIPDPDPDPDPDPGSAGVSFAFASRNVTDPIFEVEHLSLMYPGRPRHAATATLNDVSFSLERGRALTLVGPSGSGKSASHPARTKRAPGVPPEIAATSGRAIRVVLTTTGASVRLADVAHTHPWSPRNRQGTSWERFPGAGVPAARFVRGGVARVERRLPSSLLALLKRCVDIDLAK
jgi:hypothetical protein